MATFSDNLNGTSGDLLRSRSGWSRAIGSDEVQINTGGSGVAITNGTTAASGTWHVPTSQPSGADQYTEGFLKTGPASGGARPLCVRADTSSATGAAYTARRNAANAIIVHRRSGTGTFTQIGSYTVSPSTDFDTKAVKLEAVGTQITVYLGGTTVIGPITDSAIASGSIAILSLGGSLTSSENILDDMGWGDVGAASQSLTPSLFTNGQTFYAGTVAPGAVSLAPALFTNDQTFYAATVSTGAQIVAPPAVTNSQSFFAATITPGAVALAPSLLASGNAFYSATISADGGPVTLLPGLLDNVQSFFAASVAPGAVTIAPPAIASGNAFYSATVSAGRSIAPALLVNSQSFFAASIATGAVSILPPLAANDNVFFGGSIASGDDTQYPLAGMAQGRPLDGLSQGYPLAGQSQQYPLYGRAA